MAFKFGIIQSIDPTITLICFIIVVAFIIFFEHATEVLEYLLEENQMYRKIVQVIYKELMLMGVISFSIIMYQASKTTVASENETNIIVAIDFAHIILFYMTIFFVFHAIYLIRISIYNHRKNRGYFAKTLKSLAHQVGELENKPWWNPRKWLFHSDILLLSPLRDKAEFKIVQTIFQALYLVPRNFNYPAYISGCYERYALKTINRSLVSWFILLFVILVNYLRLYLGYNCTIHNYGGSSHRLLGGSSAGGTTTATDPAIAHHIQREDDACRKLTMREFLVVGAMITVYNLGVLIASRIYKMRLVQFSGIKGSRDIAGYLTYLHTFEEDLKKEIKATKRFSTKQLLMEIETTINETEHDEEEETIRFLASMLTRGVSYIRTVISEVRYGLRLLIIAIFCPKRRRQKLLRQRTSVLIPGSPGTSARTQKLARTSSGVELQDALDEGKRQPAKNKDTQSETAKRLHKPHYAEEENSDIGETTSNKPSSLLGNIWSWLTSTNSLSTNQYSLEKQAGEEQSGEMYRHTSTLLKMMREQRRFPTIQERVCVQMDQDLPTCGSAARLSILHGSHDQDYTPANREFNNEFEFKNDGNDFGHYFSEDEPNAPVDHHHINAYPTIHNAIEVENKSNTHTNGQRHGMISSSSNSSRDILYDGPAKHNHRVSNPSPPKHGAKEYRLRAAAASFYYQQRMTNWLVEQQLHGIPIEEDDEDEDIASDESDSGDNNSSMPRSSAKTEEAEDEEYGELIANDPSIGEHHFFQHVNQLHGLPLYHPYHPMVTLTPPTSPRTPLTLHSATHHIAQPPLLVSSHILAGSEQISATSSQRTQMSGNSAGESNPDPNAGSSSVRSPQPTMPPTTSKQDGTSKPTSPLSSARNPHGSKGPIVSSSTAKPPQRLCAVRSYRDMTNKSEELKPTNRSGGKNHTKLTQENSNSKECISPTQDLDYVGLEEGERKEMTDNQGSNKAMVFDTLFDNSSSKAPYFDPKPNHSNPVQEESLLIEDDNDLVPNDHISDHAEQGDDDIGVAGNRGPTVPEKFQNIFFLRRPEWFFRSIELSIMFSSLFMALWVTNMISIVRDIQHADRSFIILAELYMVVPILLHFYTLPSITETCALVTALYQLDVNVAKDVLNDTVETNRLLKTVRRKILARTAHQVMLAERMQRDVRDEIQRRELDQQVTRLLHLDQDITRLLHVHDKRLVLVQRLQRRLQQLQPAEMTQNQDLDAKIKSLKEEVRIEVKRFRHTTKKLTMAQEERKKAWHEFETLKEAIDNTDLEQRRRFIDDLFEEMDQDGSGSIDRDEFREMLRQLSLRLSDHKFRLLFRAIDSVNGDGLIQREELHRFLFPPASVMLLDEAREWKRRQQRLDDHGVDPMLVDDVNLTSPRHQQHSMTSNTSRLANNKMGLHHRRPQSRQTQQSAQRYGDGKDEDEDDMDRDLGIEVTVGTNTPTHQQTQHRAHRRPSAASSSAAAANIAATNATPKHRQHHHHHHHHHTAHHKKQQSRHSSHAHNRRSHSRDEDELSSHSSDSSEY